MSEIVTRHLRIFGRVQGVWYRESMRQEAERLKITGWVRNRLDGSVEAVVQGDTDSVDRIVKWCRRGPQQAQVTHIDMNDTIPSAGGGMKFDTFAKLGTM